MNLYFAYFSFGEYGNLFKFGIEKLIDTIYDTTYNIDRRYSIPRHEPIKKVYVEMVKQIVESEAVNDENAE